MPAFGAEVAGEPDAGEFVTTIRAAAGIDFFFRNERLVLLIGKENTAPNRAGGE